MPSKELRVGLVGCGFMGRAHSNAHRRVGNFFNLEYQPVLKAICDFNEQKAKAHGAQWGFESVETDYQKMLARDDIDLVDICLPNNLHAEVAIAAAKAGKMILCEKPLARDGGRHDARRCDRALRRRRGAPRLRHQRHRRQTATAGISADAGPGAFEPGLDGEGGQVQLGRVGGLAVVDGHNQFECRVD